jgi:DnaJ domain
VTLQADVDAVRRSYAALGLRAGAPLAEVRRRYRFLAQRWHPDRHTSDPRNVADANAEMRRINHAYQAIAQRQATERGGSVPEPERRLSPDDIDRLVSAIGSEGPMDWVLDSLRWVGNAYEALLLVVGGAIIAVQLARSLWQRDFSTLRQHPEMIPILGLILLLVIREWLARDRVAQPGARHGE